MSWLGMTNHDLSIRVPNLILWYGGFHTAYTLFRGAMCLKNQFFTWIYSFFNAKKYLKPLPDKIGPQHPMQRAPSAGPGIQGEPG